MKRHAVAFLLHPYKNVLLPREELKQAVDGFAEAFLQIGAEHPNMRWNLVLPGYILECVDGILLSRLREMQKKGTLEWLCCGYTEPFLSFSPAWLSQQNIKAGLESMTELTGVRPGGFFPPFSNWEPSHISGFQALGLNYAVMSNAAFSHSSRNHCSYWATEHMGSSIMLFPLHTLHQFSVPWSMPGWLEQRFGQDSQQASATRLACVSYLIPLVASKELDALAWVRQTADSLEKHLHEYQTVKFEELLTMAPPAGLEYVGPSLVVNREDSETVPGFQDYLHTYDQIGILQRRMMEVADSLASRGTAKRLHSLRRELYFAQDVNRFLPAQNGGFLNAQERQWTYAKLIGVEAHLNDLDKISGGQIRIADFMKNGSKSVIMSNKALKIYIDHRNGGHLFELDYRPRTINIFAGCNPQRHDIPRIMVPGKSRSAFIDHVLPANTGHEEFIPRTAVELSDFLGGTFEYSVKKTPSSVRCVLVRDGSILAGEKNCPVTLEKVFGLENDAPVLSFVYHLSNHSLVPLVFKFAIELTIYLPGVTDGQARFSSGKTSHEGLKYARFELPQTNSWALADQKEGFTLEFVTQKPVDLWCFPATAGTVEPTAYQGTTLVMSSAVNLEEGAPWKLMGKIECKKTRAKVKQTDAC